MNSTVKEPQRFRWASRLASRWTRFRRYISLHPAMATVAGLIVLLVAAEIALVASAAAHNDRELHRVNALPHSTIGEFQAALADNGIQSITLLRLDAGTLLAPEHLTVLEALDRQGQSRVLEVPSAMESFVLEPLRGAVGKSDVRFASGYDHFNSMPVTQVLGTTLLLLALLVGLVFAQRFVGEAVSGQSTRPQAPDTKTRLDDVIGYDAIKDELREIMDHFQRPEHFEAMGRRIPRGILLSGDPGVGKTMMARALANEIKATFYACSASDFVEMYVGVGARRVRSLFKQARMSGKAVIFIDEFDAFGSRDAIGQDSERLSTINQMLTEMDGMSTNNNILVLAATNRVERIDAALRRPGRFDRVVHIPLPDRGTRRGILQKYCEGKTMDACVDLDDMALRTQGYSGAQLRQVVDDAFTLASRESAAGVPIVTHEHLVQGQMTALTGLFKNKLSESEMKISSVHELGHALVGHLCSSDTRVDRVTIQGAGGALGYTLSVPVDDLRLRTREGLLGEIAMLVGGRAAEDVVFGTVSTGAADDLDRANRIAREMVARLGMGPTTGLLTWKAPHPDAPLPDAMQQQVQLMLEQQYQRACQLVERHRSWMDHMAERLCAQGVLGHDALFASMDSFAEKQAALAA